MRSDVPKTYHLQTTDDSWKSTRSSLHLLTLPSMPRNFFRRFPRWVKSRSFLQRVVSSPWTSSMLPHTQIKKPPLGKVLLTKRLDSGIGKLMAVFLVSPQLVPHLSWSLLSKDECLIGVCPSCKSKILIVSRHSIFSRPHFSSTASSKIRV